MNPKDTLTALQDWIRAQTDKAHSMAVKYIEDNVDLIDTDLQKFMENCPRSCDLEVYEMLLKAGIDMKDHIVSGSLKQWSNYIHANKMNDYIKKTITYKSQYMFDSIVIDDIPVVNEGSGSCTL